MEGDDLGVFDFVDVPAVESPHNLRLGDQGHVEDVFYGENPDQREHVQILNPRRGFDDRVEVVCAETPACLALHHELGTFREVQGLEDEVVWGYVEFHGG